MDSCFAPFLCLCKQSTRFSRFLLLLPLASSSCKSIHFLTSKERERETQRSTDSFNLSHWQQLQQQLELLLRLFHLSLILPLQNFTLLGLLPLSVLLLPLHFSPHFVGKKGESLNTSGGFSCLYISSLCILSTEYQLYFYQNICLRHGKAIL